MTFMNELEVLEARFHELYEMVEAFVIVELGMTHQGSRRNSTFASCRSTPSCHARFAPFLDKVHYTFVGSLPPCRLGEAWSCENAHRELLASAFVAAGGTDEDVAIVGDADEFPRASTAWTLSHCEVPERLSIETDFYYFSAHCRVPYPDLRLKAVSGRVLRAMGAQAVRKENGFHIGEPGWANFTSGGFHLSYFMRPDEIVDKVRSFAHTEFNRFPFTTMAWHLENARSCTFSVAWVHVQAEYVPREQIHYPRVPWFAVEHPDRAPRFFAYGRHEPGASGDGNVAVGVERLAVCISGQIRGQSHWAALGAVERWALGAGMEADVFVVVPAEDCRLAEGHSKMQRGHWRVRCVPDEPLSPPEQRFVEEGPEVDFIGLDHRRAHVLQYRLVHECSHLIGEAGAEYGWILRKRSDVFLRSMPAMESLREHAVYTAYRDKDLHLGGLNDKLLLARPGQMSHVFAFYDFMIDPSAWPALRMICSTATFSRTLSRYHVSELANVTGPAEAILQSFLMVRGVPVRAHRELRYDRPSGGKLAEVNSLDEMMGATGIFGAVPNPDAQSNVYPRDIYLLAPMLSLLLHDQNLNMNGEPVVVMDCGCGTGFLVKELNAWHVSAFGIEGNAAAFWPVIGPMAHVADLTQNFEDIPVIATTVGTLRTRRRDQPLVNETNASITMTLNLAENDSEFKPGRADWVLSIDVGSYVPLELLEPFLRNLVGYAERGVVLRWGAGPHWIPVESIERPLGRLGLRRDRAMERHFALFSGLLGPSRGPVFVYAFEGPLPGGVLPWLSEGGPQPHTVEHTWARALTYADPFEPNRDAAHFTSGEDVWIEGEVEIAASYLRLWRALLRPWEAAEVLAPLHLPAAAAVGGGWPAGRRAWGSLTWEAIASASWDLAEPMQLLLSRRPDLLNGLASADDVARLVERRSAAAQAGEAAPAAGERRSLLSADAANGLSAGHGVATALAAGTDAAAASARRPFGLHRQAWLHRLASRFDSG